MKRDMDLCRAILLKMEEKDCLDKCAVDALLSDQYSLDEIIYHCRLLHEHGFIKECEINGALGVVATFIVEGLSWEAHDFIECIREDTVWNKTKDVIVKKGLPMMLDVVREVSQTIIAAMLQGVIKGLSQ